ncbi:MAG: UDP-N-acetylmuramate dehydrogenase [Rikenellaceae bacterium]|nr:UDP-N-acetylmuramate dehydrogenase [Rikenellaceae bacterium]
MVEKQYNANLRDYNTFGIDASCRCMCRYETHRDLSELYAEGIFEGKWNVISGGSNILFNGDYDGTLVHPASGEIVTLTSGSGTVKLRADAGVVWDDFVEYCVRHGYWGAENLSYIPGYVGASPVQNIGAYGVEAKDIIDSVELFCVENGTKLILAAGHCGFGYRTSIFKTTLKGKVIITAANFVLKTEPDPRLGYGDLRDAVDRLGGASLENIRKAVTDIRKSKLPEPSELGNAGSFFKNPVVGEDIVERLKKEYPEMPVYPSGDPGKVKLAAGWLIDAAGWKGRKLGLAGVHEKQALVLVNLGGATGRDIIELAKAVTDNVASKFGVELESEVNIF